MIDDEKVNEELDGLRPDQWRSNVDFMRGLLTRSDEELKAYVEGVEDVSSDDRPVLEFSTARNRYAKFRVE